MKKALWILLGLGAAGFAAYSYFKIPPIAIGNVDNVNKTVAFTFNGIPIVFKWGTPALGANIGSYSIQQSDIKGTQTGVQINVLKNGQMITQRNIYFQ